MWERTFSMAIHTWAGEKFTSFVFVFVNCVCVKVEYVKASAKDLIIHLHLDNGKYKEYGVGSS